MPRSSATSPSSLPDGSTAIAKAAKTSHKDRWLTVKPVPQAPRAIHEGPDRRSPKSWIRLQGKWIADAGFPPEARVRVRVMPGCLVITAE